MMLAVYLSSQGALGAVKTTVLCASDEGLAIIHQPSYTVIITCQVHFLHYLISILLHGFSPFILYLKY